MAKSRDRELQLPINRSVVLVRGSEVQTVDGEHITADLIGLKGLGLLRIPQCWVPDFFVVSGDCPPSQQAIERAASIIGLSRESDCWVRSSGTLEGLEERGSLESKRTQLGRVERAVAELQTHPTFQVARKIQAIHFVVQAHIFAKKKGHLSNERRLQRQPRDWTYEVEGEVSHHLGVRKWRNATLKVSSSLTAEAFAHVPHALRAIAAWNGNLRSHIEWVWDGSAVWVVQLDLLTDSKTGVSPSSLVSQAHRPSVSPEELKLFIPADLKNTTQFPKLDNARLYDSFGYSMPTFYLLDKPEEFARILEDGTVTSELEHDLGILCTHPFVLRTDATGLAPDRRQMLPRSDELRSPEAAVEWLTSSFRDTISGIQGASKIVLIGHHFIPAIASAWCQATPDDRRSRIESLWGIPEGLYCFAHDVFDVDTMSLSLDGKTFESAKILMQRERFKGKFVAPNDQGEWKVHETASGPDWTRSIRYDSWVKQIAWTSREIAIKANMPVVVMWLVGVQPKGGDALLPWYHEAWKPTTGRYKKAAPRTKIQSAQIRRVSNRESWDALVHDVDSGALVERVIIDPKDESIIRSRSFVSELAAHAKQQKYVIELSGGLLSHFYYMLSKEGCNVECVDLFAVSEEAIEFNKLVRDKIPEEIQQHGEAVQVFELHGDALIASLKQKIVEEAYEVLQADTVDDMAEELADLTEVVDSLVQALRLSKGDISDRQTAKRNKRGGFSKGLMLARTSLLPPLRGQIDESEKDEQFKKLNDVIELPPFETDFHVDQRFDLSGVPERQITMTLSTLVDDYSSGEHAFDMPMPSGDTHAMFFNSHVERHGATLKLKVRLTSAAQQLVLPLQTGEPKSPRATDPKD